MRFVVLDSWRGICALLVVLMHFDGLWSFFEASFIQNSYLFVDFFFVLSGFVITHGYCDQITRVDDAMQFMVRRFIRLWPLHVALLAVFLMVELAALLLHPWIGDAYGRMPFTGSRDGASFVSNLLLLHAIGIHDEVTWNYPSWSISAEFCTYLIFGLCVATARRWMIVVAIVMAVAGAGIIFLFYELRTIDVMADYGLYRCLYGFFVGYLVYRIYLASERFLMAQRISASAIELGALLLAITFVCSAGRSPASLAAPLVFASVVYAFAFERGVVSSWLQARPMIWLGRHSYSIYMVHAFVLLIIESAAGIAAKLCHVSLRQNWQAGLTERKVLVFDSVWAMDMLVVVYMAVVIGFAAITSRFIELPGRHVLNEALGQMVLPWKDRLPRLVSLPR